MTERVGLIGDPVALSLSPRIQAAALEATGLDWEYQLVSVGRGQLASRWDELRARERLIAREIERDEVPL